MKKRIAAIYDLHGNLPALEAVLEDIRHAGVELLIVGGDIVPGPMPRETLELLLDLEIPVEFIKGNGEADALEAMAGGELARVPEPYREIVRWSAGQLYPYYQKTLADWPETLSLEVEPFGRVLFCHATPRDDNEIFTRLTPEKALISIFDEARADLIVCGHTHMQFDRLIGKTRVVNAGSLGMPFGPAGANWLLLGPEVHLCRTTFDLNAAAELVRRTDYPEAEDFAAQSILEPPDEKAMLDLFTNAGLK
ncbi:MAG: metallophosphoesterase family protein [Pyrinomonadaceae bacterium]